MKPRVKLMGILNVTPDSFSDGGQYLHPNDAVEQAEALLEAGAGMVDIGAESTRPGATPLDAAAEWERLEPVLRALSPRGFPLSIDTRHAATAQKALDHGVGLINDVSGGDEAMLRIIANADCHYVLTHSLGVPASAGQRMPDAMDPVREVEGWFLRRLAELQELGIPSSRVWLDPGIGFGKSPRQNWQLLRHASELAVAGCPLLVGHSRKSFLGETGRDAATLAVSLKLAGMGVEWLRVHDVASHRAALDAWDGMEGMADV